MIILSLHRLNPKKVQIHCIPKIVHTTSKNNILHSKSKIILNIQYLVSSLNNCILLQKRKIIQTLCQLSNPKLSLHSGVTPLCQELTTFSAQTTMSMTLQKVGACQMGIPIHEGGGKEEWIAHGIHCDKAIFVPYK